MPVIQRYQRQVSIPGTSGSVQARGQLVPDFSAAGNALADIADIVVRRQDELRRQDMVNKAITIGTAYDDEQRAFEGRELQLTGQDTYDNVTRAEKFRQDAIAKYTADIKDEELRAAVTKQILSSSSSMLDGLSAHQAKQRKGVTIQAASNLLAGLAKDAYAGKDLQANIKKFQTAIVAQRTAGALGEEEAVEAITKGEQALAEAHLDGIISRDPAAGIAAIEAGTFSGYLPQEKIEAYDNKAKLLRDALQAEADRVAERREREQEKALKKEQNDLELDLRIQLANGALAEKDIVEAGRSRRLRPEQFEQLMDDLKKEDGEGKGDPAALLNHTLQIIDGSATDDSILRDPGLTSKDKIALIEKRRNAEEKQGDEREKRIKTDLGRIKDQIQPWIISTGPLAQLVKQDEQILFQQALTEAEERIRAGEPAEAITSDVIQRYRRAEPTSDSLPRLRYGTADDLTEAKRRLAAAVTKQEIDQLAAEREAELIQQYERALAYEQRLKDLKSTTKARK